MSDTIEILWEDEIEFPYESFSIHYNVTHNEWYAEHYNEDLFEDIVLINEPELPISLFNEYYLTVQEFLELKKLTEGI